MSKMRVAVDSRWKGTHGIQRFAREVLGRPPANVDKLELSGGPRFSSPLGPLWLDHRLARSGANVLFSPGYIPPVFSRVPFVITIHDLIHIESVTHQAWLKLEYYQRVMRPAARRAARILTVSEFSKSRIMAWLGCDEERIVVVGNGVDPFFTPATATQSGVSHPYFLYVGGHKPHKNLPRLISAFASCRLSDEYRLVLTGTPGNGLSEIVRASGVQSRIDFTGTITDEELRNYYRCAVALLLPSLYEGFGLPAGEAMACGTPVVVSRTTSLREVVGDAAVFVDPTDVDSIAGGMLRVASDAGLRQRLHTRGIERALTHSWDRTARLVWDTVLSVGRAAGAKCR